MVVKGFGHRTTGGKKSLSITRLKDGSVQKQYNMGRSVGRKRFRTEIAVYRRLSDCPFVPKLLSTNERLGRIRLSYVGKPPSGAVASSRKIRRKVRALLTELHSRHGVVRKRRGRIFYKVQTRNNITYDPAEDKVYLLDFGSRDWHVQTC